MPAIDEVTCPRDERDAMLKQTDEQWTREGLRRFVGRSSHPGSLSDAIRELLRDYDELVKWGRRALPYLAAHAAMTPPSGLADDFGDRMVHDELDRLTK